MAPRRSVKVAKVSNWDYTKLTATDVLCPICRSILIKPVTLPCSHGFCAACFQMTIQNAIVCPLCRVRIGSWLRSVTKSKSFVNEPFWRAIQDRFPAQVRSKLARGDFNGAKSQDFDENLKKANELQVIVKKDNVRHKTASTSVKNNKTKVDKCSVLLNNYANKEYTCRILCQNTGNELQKHVNSEAIQKKNKQIQQITQLSDTERSDSIESECLYFKPIDYRHNPPSEGLPPIKVPTKRLQIDSSIKIIAPSGQNKINISILQSAFARLCSSISSEKSTLPAVKRKIEKIETRSKKKLKNFDVIQLNTTSMDTLKEESKILQEKADFEFARKLQEEFNRMSKYSTRSSYSRRAAATKRQVKIGEIVQKTSRVK